MTQITKLKILVLGAKGVGKSAVVVRVLTRRYIGEYQSNIDILYKKEYNCDELSVSLEILDISSNKGISSTDLHDHILWANGFIILYDLCDKGTFHEAQQYMELISSLRSLVHLPMLLLGNKRDLEQGRQVSLSEGRNLAMSYEAQFFEVSAADSYVGVSVSFDALIRELVSQRLRRSSRSPSSASSNNSKKLSIITVSKVFGAVFGGKHNNSVYYSNIDLINSTQCSASSPESGNNKENKFKRCVPLLNSRSFCKSKKSTHATMVKVARKSSPPILSL